MKKTKPLITGQHHIQGINRKFLSLMILAFVFILTASFFSTVAAGQEPLSIKVGAYANHPKIFMNANGKVSGFWPDVIEHIAKTENWKIEYIWGTWSEGLDHLINKDIAIMPDVAFTEKRSKLYTFSEDTILSSWARVYVNKENTEIQSITDLKNKKIAVLKGSSNLEGLGGLKEIALGFNLNCTFLELDNYTEVLKAIEENRADAGTTNRNFGNKNAKNFKIKKTPIIFYPINIKFALPKDAESTPYLSERINYHIKKLKKDENSIYYRLLKNYFEAEIAEKTVEVFPGWLSTVLKSIAVVFGFFILVIIVSRIQVKRKTNEIRIKSEALQISEERYRQLFEDSPISLWEEDFSKVKEFLDDLRSSGVSNLRAHLEAHPDITAHCARIVDIIDVNKATLNLFGVDSKGEIKGNLDKLFIDRSIEVFREELMTLHEGKGLFRSEITGKSFRGNLIDCVVEVIIAPEYEDSWAKVLVSVTDITERKKAEAELRESEAGLESILTTAPVGIGLIKNRIIDWVSKRFAGMLGYTVDELIGNSFRMVYPSDDEFERVGKVKYNQIKKEGVGEIETRLKRKDGRLIDVFLRSTPLDPSDLSKGVTFTAMDISARKKSEVLLTESHETLLTVLDSIDAAIYVADMETYEILFMNKHMKDSFGTDFTGKICWEKFRNESGPCGNCTNNKLLDEEGNPAGVQMWDDQNPVIGKWFINYDRAIKWTDGRYVRLQVATDITDLKKIEAQLRQAQKMEAVGVLASGVAHDFNNILTTIIGNANLALMDVGKNVALRNEIEEIKIAGQRAADLTRQLLAFSRKQIIKPKVLDLNELLSGTKKMLARLLGEDVELLMILEPALWKVEVDPGQMEQVIMNLAINARDAMPMGGKLTLETANANLDENYFREHGIKDQPGSYVVISVSDNGSGMDKETLKHIFDPFYTTKEVGKGTGLGLSTVYGIAKQNNGFTWVYSEPGQGTAFKVYLPRVKGDAELEEKEQTPVLELRGSGTVLIVEDDDSLRKLAGTVLMQRGYKVLDAENGEDALRISKEHEGQIDLMVTDVVMPKMGGREVAERLQPLYPQMKVIYMSGYTDNAIVHHGVLEPGLNFLEKPFSPEGLARKVREVLDR